MYTKSKLAPKRFPVIQESSVTVALTKLLTASPSGFKGRAKHECISLVQAKKTVAIHLAIQDTEIG